MIYIILGTRAQLVKMAPLILEIESRKLPLTLVHTGQHKESFFELCHAFKITQPWYSLYKNENEVKTIYHAIKWFTKTLLYIGISPTSLLHQYKQSDKDILLVHGDTFSTLLGALIGKRLGVKVGHIESGLRSFHFFNPFPEEIVRILTFNLADIAFCPGQWAFDNLKQYASLKKINTQHNTLLDSLHIALKSPKDPDYLIPETAYGVVSIHRFENIFFNRRFTHIIKQLQITSEHYPLIFVLHPATLKRLNQTGLIKALTDNPNIELRTRTSYSNFIKLLSSSKFVITDGGSNQEELSYLNIPTFLMRKKTERQEGLDKNVTLGNLSANSLLSFVTNINKAFAGHSIPNFSPTEYICDEINVFISNAKD